jgi:hypothetical protein
MTIMFISPKPGQLMSNKNHHNEETDDEDVKY